MAHPTAQCALFALLAAFAGVSADPAHCSSEACLAPDWLSSMQLRRPTDEAPGPLVRSKNRLERFKNELERRPADEAPGRLVRFKNRLERLKNELKPEPVRIAGTGLPQEVWETTYAFVVQVSVDHHENRRRRRRRRRNKDPQPNRRRFTNCGGTVVDNRVLTAAHCGKIGDKWYVQAASGEIGVTDVLIHPNYDHGECSEGGCPPAPYDLALLKLENPVSPFVSNYTVALQNNTPPGFGTKLFTIGFGNKPDDLPSKSYDVPVVDCEYSQLCVADVYSSIGEGDYGGPMMQWIGNMAVIAGVSSGQSDFSDAVDVATPTADAYRWLEEVAQGVFTWVK